MCTCLGKMNISKKAIKFTKLIATQLKDLYTSTDGYDKEELKLSFKEAVGSLSKQEIQSEIQEHFDKYVRKLQIYLSVQDGQAKTANFPYNLYLEDKHQLRDTENVTKQQKEVLVSHFVSENVVKNPDVMSLLDDFPAESEVFSELSSCHKLLKLTTGCKHEETLRQIMLRYFNNIQPIAEEIMKGEDIERCCQMTREIKGFVCVCHLRKNDCHQSGEKKTPLYEDILASLLSLYTELFILSERSSDVKKKRGSQLCSFTMYVLPWQYQQLDLLLQLSLITEDDVDIIIPLSRGILKWNPDNHEEKYYLKYVLAVRSLRDKIVGPTDDIVESTKTISAPKNFMSWLQDQDEELVEEFPSDKGFKKRTITRYLLEDTTDDQIERLLDILTCDQVEQDQDQEIPQTNGNNSDNQYNEDNMEPTLSGGLFFIDKLGLGSKEKKNNEEEEDIQDDISESEKIDTDKHTDPGIESEEMDTEIFVIDTDNLIPRKEADQSENLKKKRKCIKAIDTEEVGDEKLRKRSRRSSFQPECDDDVIIIKNDSKISDSKDTFMEINQEISFGTRTNKHLDKADDEIKNNIQDSDILDHDDNVKKDRSEGIRTRRNSHKLDVDDDVKIDMNMSEGKRTRRNSHKLDVDDDVKIDMNMSEGKRTRRNSHKLDFDDDVKIDVDMSEGKRTRRNSHKLDVDDDVEIGKNMSEGKRTRRNSHKLDVDDDVEIGKNMSEGKRTRRNSHKLDVDDDVEIGKNMSEGKRTRRNSHKLDVDDDVEIGKNMSEGKRTRRNSHKLDVDDDVVKDNDEIDSILKDKKTKIVNKKQTNMESFMVPRNHIKSLGAPSDKRKAAMDEKISTRSSTKLNDSVIDTPSKCQTSKVKKMKDSPSKKTGQKSQVKDSIHVNDDIDCDELKAMADDFVSDSNDDEDDLTALIPNITEHMKNTENLNKCKTTKEQEEKHDVDLSRKTKPERRHSSSLSIEYRNVKPLDNTGSSKVNKSVEPPMLTETEKYLILSDTESDLCNKGTSQINILKERSKRRQSEPIKLKTKKTASPKSVKRRMTLRPRKN